MRLGLILAAALLTACTLQGGKGGDGMRPGTRPTNPIMGDAIATTSLDAPAPAAAAATPSAATAQPAVDAGPAAKDKAPPARPAGATAPKDTAPKDTAPNDTAATDDPPPAAAPSPPASPEEAKCVKSGGIWASAGKSGIKTCVRKTRDAGKACTKETQCEGYCLARSHTCAPITPLFGCNEILQADGRMVTLCID